MTTGIRRSLWAMLILGVWLPALSYAATITTEPISVSAGEVELASVYLSLVGGETVTLSFTPTGFTDPAQTFTYMWQQSKYGTTWHDWTGAGLIGGTLLGKAGNPKTSVESFGVSQFVGVMHIRLIGTFVGAAITLGTTIMY